MSNIALHQTIIDRWLATLHEIPEVDVVWLEGSLVDASQANPGSDIDLRLSITDDAYERLWQVDKSAILAGFGEILRLINRSWIRALTREGVIVEIAVYKTSQLEGMLLHSWRFLLNRLPDGQPLFQQLARQSPVEAWPEREPLTPEFVWKQTEVAITVLANCAGPFYNREFHSARFTLEDMRIELIKLMYREVGIYYAKRYKHFSQVLPSAFLADLDSTYLPAGAAPLDSTALAAATLRTFTVFGKHLQALSDRVGGGFEPVWYWQLHYSRCVTSLCSLPRTGFWPKMNDRQRLGIRKRNSSPCPFA